jgi:GntR family transcriptional regulator
MLEIQRDDVLLLFTARLFDDQSRVIDYSLSYFLPGYFRFHVIRRLSNGLPGN